MIKRNFIITLLLIFLFSFTSLAIQQEIQLDSKISRVQVYPESAMVFQEGGIELTKGNYRLIFTDVVEKIDDRTIHVELEKDAQSRVRIKGVSMKTILLQEEPEEKIRQLKEEIKHLEKEIKKITSEKNSLNDKKEFLNSIIYLFQDQKKADDSAMQIPSIEQLESLYVFLDEKLKINYHQNLDYDFQIEAYRDQITFLQKQLQQITEERRDSIKAISIDLEVFQKKHFKIFLAYQINKGISWQPVYDVRADIKKGNLALTTYALISQTTGVDWENVDISLSTARPTVSGQLPSIEPWFLRPYQPDERVSKTMELPMVDREESNIAGTALKEPDFLVPVEHKGTSLSFHIPQKVSIPSGSSREKVMISEKQLAGKLNYKAYPRISPYMYFNVLVENHLDIPLLPGNVNIFLDGGFTGNTYLNYIPPGEDFDISLGIAENVKVKRELLKKFRDETLISNIPSSKVVTKYEYKITVENFQEIESSCQIFESIPVPEDDRIQVNLEKVTKDPEERDWNSKRGVWMWELLLGPQEKTEIYITYSIIHPRDMQIIGLP